jgi:hypothetical protein
MEKHRWLRAAERVPPISQANSASALKPRTLMAKPTSWALDRYHSRPSKRPSATGSSRN